MRMREENRGLTGSGRALVLGGADVCDREMCVDLDAVRREFESPIVCCVVIFIIIDVRRAHCTKTGTLLSRDYSIRQSRTSPEGSAP